MTLAPLADLCVLVALKEEQKQIDAAIGRLHSDLREARDRIAHLHGDLNAASALLANNSAKQFETASRLARMVLR